MKCPAKILLFYVINIIYANPAQQPDEVSKEVDKLIGKILHADKFNELADRIADRAVIKLSDFQRTTIDVNDAVNKGLLLNSRKDHSNGDIMSPKKHKHGKIDVTAVLRKKILPLDSLKLRYKNLKNLHYMAHVKDDNKQTPSSEETKSHHNIGQNLKIDYEKIDNISEEIFENTNDDDETKNRNLNTSSPIVQTDGNRTFAYMNSPDYKEYHEQLAKLKEALS